MHTRNPFNIMCFALIAIGALSLAACKSVSGEGRWSGLSSRIESERDFSDAHIEWSETESNSVWVAKYTADRLVIHCAKIDLTAPTLRIAMLPDNRAPEERPKMGERSASEGQPETSGLAMSAGHSETAGRSTTPPSSVTATRKSKPVPIKKFCAENNLAVAFNTTPYKAGGLFKNINKTPVGIIINNSTMLSKPVASYCALAFYKPRPSEGGFRARIFATQGDAELQEAVFAAGGFWQILDNNATIQFKKIRDSRTVCGIDKDGRTLYVFAVEGENKAKSAGLTYMECAEFSKRLGAVNAICFDGGASTQLAVDGKALLSYGSKTRVPALLGFGF